MSSVVSNPMTPNPRPSAAQTRGLRAGSTDTKLAERVAANIEDGVIAAGWPVGTLLGSEADLIARHNVSRGVLREAIRLVEHHQVAAMRRGPRGGLVVQAPKTGPTTTALIVYLDYVGTSVAQLMEARRALEPLAFELATKTRTDEDIADLRNALLHPNAAGRGDQLASFDRCLHRHVAEISRNVALELFVTVLAGLTDRYARPSKVRSAADLTSVMDETQGAHADLVDALEARDADAARERVERHLDSMEGWLTARRNSGPVNMTPVANPREPPPRAKLAEVLAGEIIDDIVAAGWPVGEVFGSESDLLERYGCGRAALREAVRLLEHHSVARTRRGPGGGLLVTAPDPAASVTAMALYLAYSQVSSADLSAVRNAIELACIDKLVRNASDPKIANGLRTAHRLDDLSTNADLVKHGDDLHHALADLSGNPILALFLRIVTTLSHRHNANMIDSATLVRSGAARTVARAHTEIVDALLAQDGPLAAKLLGTHLDSTVPLWML
jgi:DNA-binding FadR family transcriptional regulator